jgi:hypothetical protein
MKSWCGPWHTQPRLLVQSSASLAPSILAAHTLLDLRGGRCNIDDP